MKATLPCPVCKAEVDLPVLTQDTGATKVHLTLDSTPLINHIKKEHRATD